MNKRSGLVSRGFVKPIIGTQRWSSKLELVAERVVLTRTTIREFAQGVGKLCLTWGQIDASLDLLINVVFREIGGQAIAKKLPIPFSARVEFLKLSCEKLEPMKIFEKRLLPILGTLEMHANMRNAVVHGYLSNYDPKSRQGVFTRLKGGGAQHEVSHITGTAKELVLAATVLQRTGTELVTLMDEIGSAFVRPLGPNPKF